MKKLLVALTVIALLTGCDLGSSSSEDIKATREIGDKLSSSQPTPTDINYSLERYNLIKRAYWVNGEREKALSLVSQVALPLGYIVLFTSNNVVAQFTVEGKVSSLNSFLTPSYYVTPGNSEATPVEIPDVDGSYGENDNGIFFFTVDGKYVEWTGDYIYSDIPLFIEDPVIQVGD